MQVDKCLIWLPLACLFVLESGALADNRLESKGGSGHQSSPHDEGFGPQISFPDNAPCLRTLPVPPILSSMDVCNAPCQHREKEALKGFYYSTSGEHWVQKKGWLNDSIHHCHWFGIYCCNRTKHVLSITMARNGLRGTLGDSLRGLQVLLGLCLGRNDIDGNLYSIFSSLSKYLLRIDMAYCDVHGEFQQSGITRFKHLKKIQLSGSINVNGNIPENIGDLSELMVLSLGESHISGNIPHSISQLTNLFFLDLETLHLLGHLELFRDMHKLEYMHLATNRIHGRIPVNFGQLYPKMIELHLHNNYITGSIPRSIGQSINLTQFHIGFNEKLEGLIPREIGSLTSLKIFSVSATALRGFERGFTFHSKVLGIFSISHLINFSCEVSFLLNILAKSLKSLMQLDAGNSNINGTLTDSIFNFDMLTLLNLKRNNIQGKLPDPKNNIEFLSNIDISNNDISGSLPSSFTKLQMLQHLNLRNNKELLGNIVPMFLRAIFEKLSRIEASANFLCPEIRFTHNNGIIQLSPDYYGRRYCVCAAGYYGIGGHCQRCLEGAFCPGVSMFNASMYSNASFLVSKKAIMTSLYIDFHYWPFPSPDNAEVLLRCPSSFQHNICNHDGSCQCRLERTNDTKQPLVTKCERKCLCRPGHHGRFCSKCIKGYYMEGKLCYKCPTGQGKASNIGGIFGIGAVVCISVFGTYLLSKKSLKITLLAVVVELGVLLSLVLLHYCPGWLLQFAVILNVFVFGSFAKGCRGIFKSVVFYFQVLDSLFSSWDFWPRGIYTVESYVSSAFNLHFSTMACYIPQLSDQVTRHFVLFSLPVLVASILLIGYCLRKLFFSLCRRVRDNDSREARLRCLRICLIFLDFCYFPITKAALKIVIPCKTASSATSSVSYMANFVWIDCNCRSYFILKTLAIISILIYTLGIPYILYVVLLVKYREKIRNEDSNVEKWLGSLYNPYKPDYRICMEVLSITKRLLIAVALAVIPSQESVQSIFIILILLGFLLFHSYAQPFSSSAAFPKMLSSAWLRSIGLENILCCLTEAVLIVSFAFVRAQMSNASDLSFWVIASVNALLLLLYGIGILATLALTNRQRLPEEIPLRQDA